MTSIRNMLTYGLATVVAAGSSLSVPAASAGRIEAGLQFSLDDGQTYQTDFPLIAEPREILVRIHWNIIGEARDIRDGIVRVSLQGDRDFASANRGLQDGRYQQRPTPYWFGLRTRQAVYRLDLRERSEGVMGTANQWDAETRSFRNEPLPPCPALPAGTHRFSVRVYYHVVDTNERVHTEPEFFVTLQPGAPAPDAAPNRPTPNAPGHDATAPPLPMPRLEGLHVFPVDDLAVLAGPADIRREDEFVRPLHNQELGWRIRGIEAGEYYLRLRVESGFQHGEDMLSPAPFVYLNGYPVAFDRAGILAPHGNTYMTILQSAAPVTLRDGDQVRWRRGRPGRVGGLALTREPLEVAPVWVRPFFDPDLHDFFRVESSWTEAENGTAHFDLAVHNVKNATDRFRVQIRVLDFFQNEIASFADDPELADRQTFETRLSIRTGASDRYRAIVAVEDPDGNRRDEVVEWLVDDRESFRRKMWLNEDWEWISLPDDGTPETRMMGTPDTLPTDADWRRVSLPATWKDHHADHHLAWYRKSFRVPEFLAGGRVFLHIERISFEGHVYVNGQQAGTNMGPGPVELEVGPLLHMGERNEIWIGVRDEIAALEPAEIERDTLVLSGRMSRWRAPAGLRAGIGEAWLFSTGDEPIEDVFVRTFYRDRRIDVDVRLPAFEGRRLLSQQVRFAGETVLTFEDRVVDTGETTVTLSRDWADPILWGPETFPLLQLVTELRDTEGRLRDRVDTRFGFREFRPEGRFLKWNGVRVKFASLPFQSTWSSYQLTRRSRRSNIRNVLLMARRMESPMLRHIYNPGAFAQMADEEGIVYAQGMSGLSGATQQKIESEPFWDHAAEFARQLITGLRNHPSIVTWYLSNEFHGQDTPANQQRLQELGRRVQPLDPTRILEFGCDIDLGGFSSVISTHYPVDLSGLRNPRAWLPHAALWRNPDDVFEPGMRVPAGQVRHVANVRGESVIPWGHKPIIVNETCWNLFFSPPDGLSRILSEAVYESSGAVEAAHKIANRTFARGHRDAEVSAITLWEHMQRDPNRISVPALEIHPIHRYGAYFSESEVVYDVNLHRDRFNAAGATFSWHLETNGQAVLTERLELHFEPCELKRERVAFTLPAVTDKTVYHLVMTLEDEAGETVQESLRVVAYPRVSHPETALRIGLYDPKGVTAVALGNVLGPERFAILETLNRAALDDLDLLILGRNAMPDPALRDVATRFVASGGRILALQRDRPLELFPVPLAPTTLNASMGLTFHPDHPLLAGLDEADLRDWRPDHRIGAGFYLKPHNGNYRVVVESAGPNGLIYAGLIEIPHGRGRFIASQLELLASPDLNPVAGILWRNLLAHLSTDPSPIAPAGYIGPAAGKGLAAWTRLGVRFESLHDAEDGIPFRTVFLDASRPLKAGEAVALRTFVEAGGQLVVGGLAPDTLAGVSALLGTDVRLHPVQPPAWHGRAVKVRRDTLLEGLTQYDFFWKERPATENYFHPFVSPGESLAPLGHWMLAGDAGRELLYPAFWLRIDLGDGFVLLDTLNWNAVFPGSDVYLGRLAGTLFTNLGVEVGVPGRVSIPANLVHEPIDLSGVMNRAFEDEVAEDGKGGWTDQGPEADLRSFPYAAGVHDFDGVPFRIERPLGCVVLQSQYRPAGAPLAVEIPVGLRADVLFFLQSSAWTSDRHHADYAVRYADGTTHTIALIGGVNYRDWATNHPDDPFLFETETATRVVWTGRGVHFPNVSLFRLAWPNPHPGKRIESITFTSQNRGIPILIGITAGRRPDTDAASPRAAADAQAADRWMAQARERIDAGRNAEAIDALRQAIAADPGRPEPRLRLGYLYEAQQAWEQAVEVYRDLIQAIPDHLEGHYRLGQCHEQTGDDAEAMAVYRRSLEVNLNQPEVIEALATVRRRLEGR